jgi:hypothetical protein
MGAAGEMTVIVKSHRILSEGLISYRRPIRRRNGTSMRIPLIENP